MTAYTALLHLILLAWSAKRVKNYLDRALNRSTRKHLNRVESKVAYNKINGKNKITFPCMQIEKCNLPNKTSCIRSKLIYYANDLLLQTRIYSQ